jgi:hypothetical protein
LSCRVAKPLRGWCREENRLPTYRVCNSRYFQYLGSFVLFPAKPIFLGAEQSVVKTSGYKSDVSLIRGQISPLRPSASGRKDRRREQARIHYRIPAALRQGTAQDLRGRVRRDSIQWRRSLGVARGPKTRYFAFGNPCRCGGPERRPSEPDQDKRSMDRCDTSDRQACVGKRWIVWCRADESLPAGAIFLLAVRSFES